LRKGTWTVASSGHTVVAEDTYWNWYGKRGVQWIRAKHQASGKHVFFMNYHGALSVNSGGKCGGWTTAHSLLKVAQDNGRHGDTIIFVGDFNSNLASTLLQELRRHLLHVYSGLVYGGRYCRSCGGTCCMCTQVLSMAVLTMSSATQKVSL